MQIQILNEPDPEINHKFKALKKSNKIFENVVKVKNSDLDSEVHSRLYKKSNYNSKRMNSQNKDGKESDKVVAISAEE